VISIAGMTDCFTLKLDGGRRLHKGLKYPLIEGCNYQGRRVPFIKEGKSVFVKFVKNCDPDLRPFDECLIVDEDDTLLAVGRTLLNRDEMLTFHHGMAVKPEHQLNKTISSSQN